MITLCNINKLKEGDTITFGPDNVSSIKEEIFIIRYKNKIYGYLNSCPHTGAPLNWLPNQFLNLDNTLIQCANHNALFQIEKGLCIAGPCRGEYLTPVAIKIIDDQIILQNGDNFV